MAWPQSALVIMRKKLRFISRHIDRDGTLTFASFTRETKIERVFYFLALPTVFDDFALEHLPKQTRATACRVLLLVGCAIAWTHRSFFHAPALADSNATQR